MKSILIDDKVHNEIKVISQETGIKIKNLTEVALLNYIINFKEEKNGNRNIRNNT